ncbi:Na(+)-translocating NADH-quinone reductase subunit C [Teredinibacter turnerae]|uniref:Na(+)-translocating NADH-quinone reductase subunit C n=1 Tax=Teredinibacter turnerae (strain ATCC 39867 / T7901) TaxID=377629 RepID=C5BII3_TERTT|nr:Na(+)-translocating NADH-quinone reductase subunit C [Teredinibacter turnerae]ACR13988.1 NADH:ubiquinone oxidoreductase, C subunit [Teredinibacter turnerae T7901]
MANNDTIKKTITVALLLCIVCSVVVSTASVVLKPAQEANKRLDFNRNILMAAGMYDSSKSVESQFSSIEVKMVDLNTGKFTSEIDAATFDQRKAAKDPKLSSELSPEEDVANLSRRENFAKVYLVKGGDKGFSTVILPISGYGLWGTLYGFLAVESDGNTIVGLGYYDHKETPGLGAEVDNPRWKALWEGKKIYDEDGDVAISVIKGSVGPNTDDAEHKVDGLSGATLTSVGVDHMMKFWLGSDGYGPFLKNLKAGEA